MLKWVKLIFKILLFVTVISIISLATYTYGYSDKASLESEYHIITSHVKYGQTVLDSSEKRIHKLFNKQMEMADKLYFTIKRNAINGKMKELRDIFYQKFPNDFIFTNNRQFGLEIIREILVLFPELQDNSEITTDILDLQLILQEMSNSIIVHNNDILFYKKWERKWNDSDYIVGKDGILDEEKYTQFSHVMVLKF